MKNLFALLLLTLPFSIFAAPLECSTHPAKAAPKASLGALAKISQADAQKTALAAIKVVGAKVVEAELEVEDGCLVYSFDILVPGKTGIDEVMVDAGNGKVISNKHETPADEAKEAAADKAAGKAHKKK